MILMDIPGYKDYYKASSDGRIFSVRYNRFLKSSFKGSTGYVLVDLSVGGVNKTYRVHRLIALTFIPLIDAKPYVNHKNGIKHDNRVDNLEWSSHSENLLHATRILKTMGGKNNNTAKLTEQNVLDIREKYSKGIKVRSLSQEYGTTSSNIKAIVDKKSWRYLG